MAKTFAVKLDISVGVEDVPVAVGDRVNTSHLQDFKYCKVNIPGPGCDMDLFTEQFQGCECKENCKVNKCSCLRYGTAYDGNRRLRVQPTDSVLEMNPVIECNQSCLCPKDCSQRVVQLGIKHCLEVFQTITRGLGLRTLEFIPQYTFVCEYAGEVISLEEAKRRASLQQSADSNYILVLNEHCKGTDDEVWCTCVDPEYIGNAGRFINHSCNPNLVMVPVRVKNNIPRLALFAQRDILKGEELTFNYAGHFSSETSHKLDTPGIRSLKKCMCNETVCHGYLPFDSNLYAMLK